VAAAGSASVRRAWTASGPIDVLHLTRFGGAGAACCASCVHVPAVASFIASIEHALRCLLPPMLGWPDSHQASVGSARRLANGALSGPLTCDRHLWMKIAVFVCGLPLNDIHCTQLRQQILNLNKRPVTATAASRSCPSLQPVKCRLAAEFLQAPARHAVPLVRRSVRRADIGELRVSNHSCSHLPNACTTCNIITYSTICNPTVAPPSTQTSTQLQRPLFPVRRAPRILGSPGWRYPSGSHGCRNGRVSKTPFTYTILCLAPLEFL
jgi:hypothetical protein